MARPPLLVILTGPSGAGKDSVLARLKHRPDIVFAPTTTTRARREGERDGIDYHFVTKDEFARMLDSGELLEHAVVYGQDKGLTRNTVRKLLEGDRDVLIRVDVQGARYIKSIIPSAVTVFVAPPSSDELRKRLSERGTESPEELALRLATADSEMASRSEFDHVVVNYDLGRAVAEIEAIIREEHARPGREPIAL